MLDFRINTFLAVCRFLNYSRAAEALNITQPAVSQHIRHLEEYYGVRLFLYERKKLMLTEAGNSLRKAVNTMKNDEEMLREHLKANTRKQIIFGATRTIGDFALPSKLAGYILNHTDTNIRMLVDNTEHLLKKIDTGEIEFAFIEGYFHKAEYEFRTYASERYIAVCSEQYRFNRKPKILSDIINENIILREPGSGSREIFERHIQERNYSIQDFKRIIEIGSIHAIKSLVTAGCGITFLYEAAVRPELKSGLLQKIPLEDFDALHSFTAVWRKNSLYRNRFDEIISVLLENAVLT